MTKQSVATALANLKPARSAWDWEDYNERVKRGPVPSSRYFFGGKLIWSFAQ